MGKDRFRGASTDLFIIGGLTSKQLFAVAQGMKDVGASAMGDVAEGDYADAVAKLRGEARAILALLPEATE